MCEYKDPINGALQEALEKEGYVCKLCGAYKTECICKKK